MKKFLPWVPEILRERDFPRWDYPGVDRFRIFGLVDPRDSTLRYVGVCTSDSPTFSYLKKRPCLVRWLEDLRVANSPPVIIRFGTCEIRKYPHCIAEFIAFFEPRGRLYNRDPS